MNAKQQKYKRDGIEPMTLQEVADTMGITRERVRQIEVKALFKLRRKLSALGLTPANIFPETK